MMMSFSLISATAVLLLSSIPSARADLQCHITIDNTDICQWANRNGGLAIACVGAIAALIMFFIFCMLAFRVGYTGKAEPMSSTAFIPSRPPQLPPIYAESFESQDPMKSLPNPYPYAPRKEQALPAYAAYAQQSMTIF
ncbi:hypothetical protein BJ138DRAFT_108208 [Hygrophoropsis aurantiaca]|uniref:Uncharacterized protein n=1 Tax=Hygrophoropsis aurantiaca TaxID=72124 RepID=A0ACB8ACB7_9AGAM|nr:hypothetical protein BJ138DRAFT_108208 [Hygrophoropsis aurantiaca]